MQKMMRKIFLLLILIIVMAAPVTSVVAKPKPQVVTDPYSMIAEVNALRAANGLPPYTISPILMGIAQQHAEFMAANGMSHTGYGGTRPYQRALNAGYPLAGDLSLGGFISENITGGTNKSVQEAVLNWQGDAPHLHTMLSSDLMEIGAGVAYVGDRVFYVIDCARPTGAKPATPVNTAAPGETQQPAATVYVGPPLASTIIPNTPEVDGKLYHTVGPGETLWLIAITYGVKIVEIRALNYMTETEAIYPGEKLLVRTDAPASAQGQNSPSDDITPTASLTADAELVAPLPPTPSNTPGIGPTFTMLPTLSADSVSSFRDAGPAGANSPDTIWTALPSSPTPASTISAPASPGISSTSSMMIVGSIVLAALVLAGVLVRAGRSSG